MIRNVVVTIAARRTLIQRVDYTDREGNQHHRSSFAGIIARAASADRSASRRPRACRSCSNKSAAAGRRRYGHGRRLNGGVTMAQDFSFDVVSKTDMQEVANAMQQAQKELAQRFDFKGSKSSIELTAEEIMLVSDDEGKLAASRTSWRRSWSSAASSLKALDYGKIEHAAGGTVRQHAKIVQGIESEKAKAIVRAIKDAKLKVQASIQSDQVRVTGRNKDDLQKAIALVKEKRLRHPAAVHELPRLSGADRIDYPCRRDRSHRRAQRAALARRAPSRARSRPSCSWSRRSCAATSSRRSGPSSDVGDHILGGGGKRLRPALLLLVSKMLRYEGYRDVVYGAVIEFIHTATLVHDDIIDEAAIRRGRTSINYRWGNNLTVLVGDYLYTHSMNIALAEGNLDILRLLSNVTIRMIEGEILGLEHERPRRSHHRRLLRDRRPQDRGALRRLLPHPGVPRRRRRRPLATSLFNYGFNLGVCFQLIDDLLDFTSSTEVLGKPALSDLKEGKADAAADPGHAARHAARAGDDRARRRD